VIVACNALKPDDWRDATQVTLFANDAQTPDKFLNIVQEMLDEGGVLDYNGVRLHHFDYNDTWSIIVGMKHCGHLYSLHGPIVAADYELPAKWRAAQDNANTPF
jgi:hypothetical protein